MKAFDQALEITIHETPGNWVWWFLSTIDPCRFELVAIYKNETDFIHHGLFFGALDRTDATRLCHNLNCDLFGNSKTDNITIIETVSKHLQYLDDLVKCS